ncbi:MAG: putative Ig domain-containing protein, partial [Kiritimatiellae bacterium]|nr:putative Ig domain-containing protein [Kiritimatiellia bacterium]
KLDAPTAVFVPVDDDRLSKLRLEGDQPLAADAVVTNLYLCDDSLSYVTATVTGLPNGMTFNATNLKFGGTPVEDGVYILMVAAKNASGYQMKQALRLVVGTDDPSVETPEVEYAPTYPLTVVVAAGGGGTASGTGVYAENKVVAVKATPAKNRVFAGWFEDAACTMPAPMATDYRAPAGKVRVPDVRYLFAKFVKKGAATDPVTNVACASVDESGTLTMMVGVKLPAPTR